MTRSKQIMLISAVCLVALGGYYAYAKRDAANPEQRYKTHVLTRGDVTQTVSANGTLNPVTLVSVGTQVSGTVKKLHVDFNDQVKAGQVLAELDDAIYSAQVRQSDASMASAQASLQLARANETRMKSLFKEEYVSRQELDQAVQVREAAEAQARLAQGDDAGVSAELAKALARTGLDE